MARAQDPAQLRRRIEMHARWFFRIPRGTRTQWQALGDGQHRVDTLDVVPRNLSSDKVVLYLHGGGFVFGSPKVYAALAGQLAQRLGARVVLPRYRLAPEHIFPAASDDVRAAWDGLLRSGIAPDRIVIGGDSAGGALTLSLLHRLGQEQGLMPAAAFCFSPLTDLTFSGESFRKNAKVEAVLPAERAHSMAEMYLQNGNPKDPQVSPIFGHFNGAAPVWITVGDTEILYDDARRMVQVLIESGVDVTFVEQQDLPHVWPLFHDILPEARQTLNNLADWIRQIPARQGES
ncbi:alpha/beta hydrolase [Sulfitobacter sp. M57]|uniref:alpha/beta hydrolase n=1 Tax=unclassified Sulfitobacter TaxID=196795 RepID=UPI0023E22C40|nr:MULTISPECIES: alpha/beta hydrolase [unclassified Sulfitobacter]MDF3414561.1 alpha/beta hydrolase [Sulfitobacter sp. KE5]MDF3422042.1 alpha/beta hydrolase [Sulfitobacter sp. KE43]MDF3433107.1 alpha/beta hydrolase [Sulfitobacter sp. KE42]MDF3458747.1 alpha/beta hydrolase [Sulfitobacter sp. S74]MDF3462647.1 alpha/beta hydrolase [Sulfitobacter sp. Ks18]